MAIRIKVWNERGLMFGLTPSLPPILIVFLTSKKRLPILPGLSDRLVTPSAGHRIQWWPSSESSFVLVGTSADEQYTRRERGTNTNVRRTPSRAPMLNAARNDNARTCISERDRAPDRRSLLGSSGAQQQQSRSYASYGEIVMGNGNGGVRTMGNRNGTTSTVPQKCKLGIGGGVAGVGMVTRRSAKRMVVG
ncbi:hypothetical protein B0H13DRAFT_1865194 [Mycena leptocephala]|nr:hypothetical protein B0H13DRAFT_1865194 [Mycena leptocephala]